MEEATIRLAQFLKWMGLCGPVGKQRFAFRRVRFQSMEKLKPAGDAFYGMEIGCSSRASNMKSNSTLMNRERSRTIRKTQQFLIPIRFRPSTGRRESEVTPETSPKLTILKRVQPSRPSALMVVKPPKSRRSGRPGSSHPQRLCRPWLLRRCQSVDSRRR